jgi:transcriptional regulator with XRE-family HTH domain
MVPDEEVGHLSALGARCRALRSDRQLTLQAVAERTGLSQSMISMVERGRASPSIGTIVAISSALGVRVGDLFDFDHGGQLDPVLRKEDQDSISTRDGVTRRNAVAAADQGLGVNFNEYQVGCASAEELLHHEGFECGVVLEGTVRVDVGEASYTLTEGDSINYHSAIPHRISNIGDTPARTVWVNLETYEAS